jgi:two-component system chemotaxis sensor kinase CheA
MRKSLAQISAEFERARAHLKQAFKIAPEAARPLDRLARLAGELAAPSYEPEAEQGQASAPALIVECAGVLAAIPEHCVVEVIGKGALSRAEDAGGRLTLRLRGRALKLAALADLLRLDGASARRDEACVVVARAGQSVFGLVVDRVLGAEEVAVEPRALSHSKLFAGAAVLSDGAAILLLNMKGVAAAAGFGRLRAPASAWRANEAAERVALLVFRGAGGALQAAPLSLVARVETAEELALVDGRWTIADGTIPVLAAGGSPAKPPEGQASQLVIFARDGREIALLTEEILEVAECFADAPLQYGSGGLSLNGRATELIDIDLLWRAAEKADRTRARRVLVMDHSAYGPIHLAPLLAQAGYEVTLEAEPEAALMRHDRGERFDIILADMQGAGASRMIGALKRARDWRAVPVFALDRAAFDADALVAAMDDALAG